MKAYKVTLFVIDFDDMGDFEIIKTLENTRYPNHCFGGLTVMSVEGKDIGEWSDEHPLNQTGKKEEEYKKLFGETQCQVKQ